MPNQARLRYGTHVLLMLENSAAIEARSKFFDDIEDLLTQLLIFVIGTALFVQRSCHFGPKLRVVGSGQFRAVDSG